ncbi:MAG: NAD-dependent epimerase/dehydratase family protein [Abditibacteriales bacterium]|nr:NAD-dependent epimerase/dehydratase family protein [Abditibacteriales bacterium]MDW8364263.1 NAD-dependent epimerase/dehydratase family protein [Abditibacteriales bacterium]
MVIEGQQIFLTGGAGFLGTALARRLAGRNRLFLYDNLYRDALTASGLRDHPHVTFCQGDVLDRERLQEAMRGSTMVIHLAAIAGVDEVRKSSIRTLNVNTLGTYNVLEAARTLPNLVRLVNFSTSEVYGTMAYKVDELHDAMPGSVGELRWTYAVSKLVGEHFTHAYADELGMPTVTIRPFNVYGPGQVGGSAVRAFVLRAVRNQNLIVRGDGSQIRAWCYVDDLVEGVLLALERPEAVGQTFNIGNPRSTITIYNLAREVIRLSGATSQIEFAPLGYVDIDLRIPNIDKARTLLGYEPRVELEEGLQRTIAWFREREGLSSSD